MKILMVGFGHVGRRLARLWTVEPGRFPGLGRLDVRVVGIVTATRGSLENPSGVPLDRALREVGTAGRFLDDNPDRVSLTALEAARSLDYDALVELSPLRIERRGEPAAGWIRAALERGRHVVSANKGPLAFAYRDLMAAARSGGALLLHEAAVMDGAPVFNLARHCLRGCRVVELEGVLNSTTNFALTRMEEGESLASAVREAQRLGFAEADPAHDLEGWDSAAKICVLANALMDASIAPTEIPRQGLASLDPGDVRRVAAAGRKLKLVCRARRDPEVAAEVALESFAADHPFSAVAGSGSILKISTDLMTPIFVSQENPGLDDTAYGVLSDLLEVARILRG